MIKKIKPSVTFHCDYCGRTFALKSNLIKHVGMHTAQEALPRTEGLTCFTCNIVFKNKGLLMCHNAKIHSLKSTPQPAIESKFKFVCAVCQMNFFYLKDLRHHIRDLHFNLVTHIPYCHFKKVNQIWFEKVLNSKNIIEIKKVAENILLMRKLDDNTAMKVSDHDTELLDLRSLYPTKREDNIECPHCHKTYDKKYICKHITDLHLRYINKDTEVKQT